jgi:hypothetical protein
MRIIRIFGILLLSCFCGALYVTLCYKVSSLTYRNGDLATLIYFGSVFCVLIVLVAALVRFTEWGSQLSIPFFLIGVAVGVIYDAVTDKTQDRNIFPIEAAIWCAILAPALGFGKGLGARLKKNRKANADHEPLNSPTGSS